MDEGSASGCGITIGSCVNMIEEGKGMVLRWQQMDCFALGRRWTRDYGNEVMCRTCLVDESRNGKTLLKTWTCVL